MSWSLPLKRTMPRCFTSGSKAAKPALCRLRPATTEIYAQTVPGSGFFSAKRAPILCFKLVAVRKRVCRIMDAAAVLLKSP